MTLAEILTRSTTLPAAQQQELADFAEFLLSRYGTESANTAGQNAGQSADQNADELAFSRWLGGQGPRRPHAPLNQEPAFGLWADRPEMADSTAYVRTLRAIRQQALCNGITTLTQDEVLAEVCQRRGGNG